MNYIMQCYILDQFQNSFGIDWHGIDWRSPDSINIAMYINLEYDILLSYYNLSSVTDSVR